MKGKKKKMVQAAAALLAVLYIFVGSNIAADAASQKLPAVKITSVACTSGGKITIKWKKVAKASGYQMLLSLDKNGKNNRKVVNISTGSKKTKTVSGLKQGKRYYIKIRAYTLSGKKKVYGSWSSSKRSAAVKKLPASTTGNGIDKDTAAGETENGTTPSASTGTTGSTGASGGTDISGSAGTTGSAGTGTTGSTGASGGTDISGSAGTSNTGIPGGTDKNPADTNAAPSGGTDTNTKVPAGTAGSDSSTANEKYISDLLKNHTHSWQPHTAVENGITYIDYYTCAWRSMGCNEIKKGEEKPSVSTGQNAGGTSSAGNAGGTSSAGNAGGTSSAGNAGGTSSAGQNAGGTSSAGNTGGTSSTGQDPASGPQEQQPGGNGSGSSAGNTQNSIDADKTATVWGFSLTSWDNRMTVKYASQEGSSKRTPNGGHMYTAMFASNGGVNWAEGVEFIAEDVTPNAYKRMYQAVGADSGIINVSASTKTAAMGYNDLGEIMEPLDDLESTPVVRQEPASVVQEISVQADLATRAVKLTAKKDGKILDTLYIIVSSFVGGELTPYAEQDQEIYKKVRRMVEQKVWERKGASSNLDKLLALAEYINNTCHYPNTEIVSRSNPEFWNDWSVDGFALYQDISKDPVLRKTMVFQGGITTCWAAEVLAVVASEDMGLELFAQPGQADVQGAEGVWLGMGDDSSMMNNPAHESLIYRDPQGKLTYIDAQGMTAERGNCSQHGCREFMVSLD